MPGGTQSAGPLLFSSTLESETSVFYKTKSPAYFRTLSFFGGRGWITQAAHLKRPRRGLFAAGTYSGGRCCSNPPLRRFTNFRIKQKLQCHYNTGVLGGRGWIRTTEAEKQQIYSLSPLATREHAHILFTVHAGLPVYLTTAPWICQVFCRKLFCMNAGSLFPKRKTPEPSTDSGALNGAGDRS